MMNNNTPLVSIIVPVYNAEKMLHIALDTILAQSYRALEVVVVNDASTDFSRRIISSYIPFMEEKGIKVKDINHPKNQGVAAARNTGLDHASGEYIYYVDADDRLEVNAIEWLVRTALSERADIVGCNWFLSFKRNERVMPQPAFASPWEAIEKLLTGKMRWNLWLFMVKRSLYEDHGIRFIPGQDMGEDLLVMIKLFSYARSVGYLGLPLYHYGQANEQSLTKTYSAKHMEDVTANVAEVERFLLGSAYADRLGNLLDCLKLNIKLPLLISNQTSDYRRWLKWFPEVSGQATHHRLPRRIRLIQWAAVRHQFWLVKMHYYFVIKFVYGVLYR